MSSKAIKVKSISDEIKELKSSISDHTKAESLDTFILSEYSQSWQQMRHHENNRLKIVAFIFSISLASIGILGALITKIDSNPKTISFLCITICVVAAVTCKYLNKMSVSIRDLSRFHETIISGIKHDALGEKLVSEMDGRAAAEGIKGRLGLGDAIAMLSSIITYIFVLLTLVFLGRLLTI